jgi:hypothetical protein
MTDDLRAPWNFGALFLCTACTPMGLGPACFPLGPLPLPPSPGLLVLSSIAQLPQLVDCIEYASRLVVLIGIGLAQHSALLGEVV